MNTYDIVWHDQGNAIYRNSPVEDVRPTVVEADDYEILASGNNMGGLKFFRGENTEPFLILFDIPIMITRRDA